MSTAYTRRLGFELYGRGGQTLTDAWKDGASTLHGMYSRGFPNLVMSSLTQGGTGVNVVPILDEVAAQTAYTIRRAIDLNARAFEPTEEAQQQWLDLLFGHMSGSATFATECTPGFYNNEGSLGDPRMARNAPFAGGALAYFGELKKWRDSDKLEGLEITPQ